MNREQTIEVGEDEELSDAEVVAECRRMLPTMLVVLTEWARLRDPKTGCPVMRHLLDE